MTSVYSRCNGPRHLKGGKKPGTCEFRSTCAGYWENWIVDYNMALVVPYGQGLVGHVTEVRLNRGANLIRSGSQDAVSVKNCLIRECVIGWLYFLVDANPRV